MAQESIFSSSAKPQSPRSGPLDKFPAEVREAHARFLAEGDAHALDTVVLAVLRDHQPARARTPENASPADTVKLMGDLGFDSLALAEIVFFIEDLYQVSITSTELMTITTVGELRVFIRAKLAATGFSA